MVMALHGGSITVSSTSSAGTTFVAIFPQRDAAPDARLSHQVLSP
jgi:signal transduction histidine kinase